VRRAKPRYTAHDRRAGLRGDAISFTGIGKPVITARSYTLRLLTFLS